MKIKRMATSQLSFFNFIFFLIPSLVWTQICTIPNKTEVTPFGTYFCPAGGSSEYRLDDLVLIDENINCAGAMGGMNTGISCLCDYNSPKPATLITSLLEGVICSNLPGAVENATFEEVMEARSQKNPFLVKGLQCKETFRMSGGVDCRIWKL